MLALKIKAYKNILYNFLKKLLNKNFLLINYIIVNNKYILSTKTLANIKADLYLIINIKFIV
jgi:hypothetical protein